MSFGRYAPIRYGNGSSIETFCRSCNNFEPSVPIANYHGGGGMKSGMKSGEDDQIDVLLDEFLNEGIEIIVLLSEMCGPCRNFKPHLLKHPKIKLMDGPSDTTFRPKAFPYLVAVKSGQKIHEALGGGDENRIHKFLKEVQAKK